MKVFSGGKIVLLFLVLSVIFLGFVSSARAKDVKKDVLDVLKGKDGLSNLSDNSSDDASVIVDAPIPDDVGSVKGMLGDVQVEFVEGGRERPRVPLEILLNNGSNETEMNMTAINISDDNITDINWSGMNETAFNETGINWTGINDTDINDTEINESLINETMINKTIPENETNASQEQGVYIGPTSYILAHGKPVARVRNDNLNYLFSDSINSVRFVADDKGMLVSRSSFYPFGQSLDKQSYQSGESTFGFTGKEQDASLSYFGARYYSPRTGAFASIDPLNQPSISPYEYARGNPVKFIDPDGKTPRHPMANEPMPMNEQMFKWNQALLSGGQRIDGIYIRDPATMQLYSGYSSLPKGAGIVGTGLMIYYNALYFFNNVHGDANGRHIPLDVEDLAMTQRDNRVRNQFLERQGLHLETNLGIRRGLGEDGLPGRYFDGNNYPLAGVEVAYLIGTIGNRRDFGNFLDFIGTNRIQYAGEDSTGAPQYVAVGDDGFGIPISNGLFQLYNQKLEWYEDKSWPKEMPRQIPEIGPAESAIPEIRNGE